MATILVGHVTKDGAVAGPRVLEHLVDCVLQFEGDRYHAHRILRATKNRFGSTNELGVFEMTGAGLVGVPDPSALFGRSEPGEVGAAVACALEGTRPLLLEIQSLVAPSDLAMPRRVATGVDPKRLAMIVAVLSRHAGVSLGAADVFVNVAGGVRIDEPGADLAIALAIASAARGAGAGEHGGVRRDRADRQAAAGDAGGAANRGVREARHHVGRRAADTPVRGRLRLVEAPTLRHAVQRGLCRARRREARLTTETTADEATPRGRCGGSGCARRSRASRRARRCDRAIDDVIRSHEGALIVIGHPTSCRSSIRAASASTSRSRRSCSTSSRRWTARSSSTRPSADRLRERPADARPDDSVGGDRNTSPHGRAGRETDGRPGRLDLPAEGDGDDLHRPCPLPARSHFSVFAKANQGLAALETYRRRLDQVLTRLTALEFQGAAVLDDVLVVVQRGEMTARMVREVERDIVELGTGGSSHPRGSTSFRASCWRSSPPSSPITTRARAAADALDALELLEGAAAPSPCSSPETVAETARLPAWREPVGLPPSAPGASGRCPTSRACRRP